MASKGKGTKIVKKAVKQQDHPPIDQTQEIVKELEKTSVTAKKDKPKATKDPKNENLGDSKSGTTKDKDASEKDKTKKIKRKK